MLKQIECKGDTIEAAVAKALAELGLERDDVSVEVLEKPRSGFLGFRKEPALVRVSYETSPKDVATKFIDGLLLRLHVSARIDAQEDLAQKVINIELSGDNMGAIIGRRGDTLDAIQYLTSIITNKVEEEHWRVVVDTENYRAKRESALETLAQKTAQKAIKYHKSVALEPMNPHERRIIHSALQNEKGVTTQSTGSEPNRRVIVAPAGEAAGQQGGQRKQGGAQGGKKPGGNQKRRRPPRKPQTPKVES